MNVILGRGEVQSSLSETRGCIIERKKEYASISGHKDERTSKIVRETVGRIHALGERFVKQVERSKSPIEDAVTEGFWTKMEDTIALEKCKQSAPSEEERLDG
jgi:hypothetical protein